MTGAFSKPCRTAPIWLDRGASRRLDRGFAQFEAWRDQVLARRKSRAAQAGRNASPREEHWMRYGVTARRKRNMRRVGLLGSLRKQRREHVGQMGNVRLAASSRRCFRQAGGRGQGHLQILWRRVIVDGLDPAGAARRPAWHRRPEWCRQDHADQAASPAQLEPDSGSIRLGTNLQIVTLDQSRQSLDPNSLLADVITDGRGAIGDHQWRDRAMW